MAVELAELSRRGIRVGVAALGTRPDGALLDPMDIPLWRPRRGLARLLGARGARALGPHLSAWRWRDRAALGDLHAWAAERGVVRVHAHFAGEAAEVARALARVLGIPYSVTAHAVDLHRPRPSLASLLRDARPVWAVCGAGARVVERVSGVTPDVLALGVKPGRPADPSRQPPRVVSVARDVPKKNLGALEAACRRLGLPLALASDRAAGPGVTSGLLPPAEVPAFLAGGQIFALPCRRAPDGDEDGIPVAILEAMAAGLPVVTTDAGGIAEVVDDDVGWLVRAGDDEAFVRALAAAAADPVARVERGGAGRARVAHRTVARQVDELLAGWERAGAGARG